MPISRRALLRLGTAGMPALCQSQAKPNIVVLFSDDQSFRTLGGLNNPEVKTPNLDRLMARGTAFTHACIMGGLQPAVCVPSRAMLLSGQSLFHATSNVVRQKEYPGSGPFHLFPEWFGNAGYQTFGIGKWHNTPALFNRSFQNGGPVMFGGMADHFKTPIFRQYDRTGQYPKTSVEPATSHSSETFADAAIGYIKNRDKQKPLLLYCAFTAPHDPRQPPQKYKDLYPEGRIQLPPNYLPEHPFDNGELKVRDELLLPFPRTEAAVRKERSDYYAMITHLDAQIGRILDTLNSENLERNTIVVFAGDNGLAVGQHGLLGKQNLYDHSIRVPLILAGPGVARGKRLSSLVYLFDVFPTLCDLTGVPKPDTLDGQSLFSGGREEMIYAYRHFQRAIRTPRWKYIRYNASGVQNRQLFDLSSDPWEKNNLVADPAHKSTAEKLDSRLQTLLKQAGDPLDLSKPDWGWKG